MKPVIRAVLAASALAVAAAASAFAQEALSEGEIVERLERQLTRGLGISAQSSGSATGQAESATTVAPLPGDYQEVDAQDNVFINISFDFDSAALRADQRPALDTMCNAMKQVDVEVFRIVGHTDASGTADYNERLSKLRAEEVRRYLVSVCGIAPERLEAVGVGESHPLDGVDPRADANRRVEFQALS